MERPSFGTTAPRPANSFSPTATASSETASDIEPAQMYKRLRQEHDMLNENRVRRTVMLQQATEEDERCRKEAEAYGASSPEELERILAERREESIRQLAEFEAALAEEARLQEQVEQDLAAAEKR